MQAKIFKYALLGTLCHIMASSLSAQHSPINTDSPFLTGIDGSNLRILNGFFSSETVTNAGRVHPTYGRMRLSSRQSWLLASVNLNKNMQIGAALPYIKTHWRLPDGDGQISGFGEIIYFAKVVVFRYRPGEGRLQGTFLAQYKPAIGPGNAHFTMASHATDYSLGGVIAYSGGRYGFYHEMRWQRNVPNSIYYDSPDAMFSNSAFTINFADDASDEETVSPFTVSLELSYQDEERYAIGTWEASNTGGRQLFWTVGLRYGIHKRASIEAAVQQPLMQKLHGNQFAVDCIITLGTRILVF